MTPDQEANQNNIKAVFERVADLAREKNKEYKFEKSSGNEGSFKIYLYFGDELVGIGEDASSAW